MVALYAILLTLVNVCFWLSLFLNLPGTWFMLLSAVLVEWLQPGVVLFSWPTLAVVAGLAVLGEVLEFVLGAAGSRRAGGSSRAASLSLVGSFLGGLLGTFIPLPIVGTLLGASIGAFLGALLGELWVGRSLFQGLTTGRGAAIGRFWGSLAKIGVGAVMLVVLTIAAFL
ncbi:MAG: DUF456 family protein [Candidatus Tectimicrobiota bacterium]